MGGAAMQRDPWAARLAPHDFDLVQCDVAKSERLDNGFLGGESRRERCRTRGALAPFFGSEDPLGEPVAEAASQLGDPLDLDNIDARLQHWRAEYSTAPC